MKALFEKLDAHTPHWKMTNTINTLIDHLTDYEAELDRRLTELDNRIQTIANNQLEVKRGEVYFVPVPFRGTGGTTVPNTVTVVPADRIDYCGDCGKEHGYDCPKEQPKRWRADANGVFWYITHWGDITQSKEFYEEDTQFRYDIGNYFRTEAEAIAYKARLLELGKQV